MGQKLDCIEGPPFKISNIKIICLKLHIAQIIDYVYLSGNSLVNLFLKKIIKIQRGEM